MILAQSRNLTSRLLLAFALLCAALIALPAMAQQPEPLPPAVGDAPAVPDVDIADPTGESAEGEETSSPADAAPGADAYEGYGPDMIKGRPVSAEEDFWGSMRFQPQHNADGRYAERMHNAILMPIIVFISLFVLGLLLWVVARYNRRANKVPSKTSHNLAIEIAWTIIPVFILLGIAIPSISLLASQYKTPPADALTVKATGYQWNWGYTYPDNGGFEIISNMMDEEEAIAQGFPGQLEVDSRMVVPVGVPIRLQTTAADVIHSFAVPSLWFKLDAVPGRLNERMLTIDEPGIYYGQCSELCGARHAYMPIAIEAVPMDRFRAWVAAQGGTFGDEGEAEGEPDVAAPQEPESAVPDAAGAGEAPTDDTAPGTPSA